MAPGGRLPARDFEEIRLAEALERDLCPVCDARQESAYAALRGLAREGASDVGFRKELDRGVGFCQPHSTGLARMELLQTSSQLATAILLEAILRRKLAALRRLPGSDAGSQARAAADVALPRCPVCARAAEASRTAISRLLALSSDPGWASALGGGQLCLEDFLAIWRTAAEGPREVQARWEPIARAQLARLEELRKLVADFAHNSTSDRRHLITPEQQAAEQAAVRLFGGSPERERTR